MAISKTQDRFISFEGDNDGTDKQKTKNEISCEFTIGHCKIVEGNLLVEIIFCMGHDTLVNVLWPDLYGHLCPFVVVFVFLLTVM